MTAHTLAPARFRTVGSTGSTNADLLAEIASGGQVVEGQWLLADRQTAGRGRHGRSWHDGFGNFMGSTAIRLRGGDPAPASLSLVVGLALFETVAPMVPARTAQLKWPNDLMVAGAKLAGILLERTGDWVVAGVGVNLVSAPALQDRRTVALSGFTPSPDRDVFAANLAGHLSRELDLWRSYGLAPLIQRWLSAAHPVGTMLTVQAPGEPLVRGRFCGLHHDGSLMLQVGDGSRMIMAAGDVLLAEEH